LLTVSQGLVGRSNVRDGERPFCIKWLQKDKAGRIDPTVTNPLGLNTSAI
jgi:hypothetical protein